MTNPLPVDEHLSAVLAAVAEHGCAVVMAPTGSGKTTRVAPALAAGRSGRVLLAQPRRVAARAAARRIAFEAGCRLGEAVGYEVRFDRVVSSRTRLVVMTDGLLLRRVLGDPLLEGIDTVVLDEFHERRLDSDLALALLREIRADVRPDLRIVVMSATLDAEAVSRFLDDAPIIRTEGRSHPVEVSWTERTDERRLEDRVAAAVRENLSHSQGSLLVFLPGAGEIRRTAERLAGLEGADVLPLHGGLSAERQDAVISPSARRRVILATNVAETSLTIPGVDVVVDSGLCRRSLTDPATGLSRLELGRISRASADQRAGRAGRERPGRAVRLWSRIDERAMEGHEVPEIVRGDLARCALELLEWGVDDLVGFGWYEAPQATAVGGAVELLVALGAVEMHSGRPSVTASGRRMLTLPLHPRLARLVLAAADRGQGEAGAILAALASTRDPRRARHEAASQSASADLLVMLDLFEEARRRRFDHSACTALGIDVRAAREVDRIAAAIVRDLARSKPQTPGGRAGSDADLLRAVLAGFPDRVARRREPGSDRAVMVGGRGLRIDRRSVVHEAEFFVALDIDAARERGADALVRSAAAIDVAWLEEVAPHLLVTRSGAELDAKGRVAGFERRCFGDLVLDERRGAAVDPGAAAAVLESAVRADPGRLLDGRPDIAALRPRWSLLRAHAPELGLPDENGPLFLDSLAALCAGMRGLEELGAAPLLDVISGQLTRRQRMALEQEVPTALTLPSGRRARLRYGERDVPILAARVQDFFGLRETPRICFGRVPCVVELLAPNGRPVQVTADLESFWRETYSRVRKDLRGRYPKHAWPENPP